jgi:hypothetical protein
LCPLAPAIKERGAVAQQYWAATRALQRARLGFKVRLEAAVGYFSACGPGGDGSAGGQQYQILADWAPVGRITLSLDADPANPAPLERNWIPAESYKVAGPCVPVPAQAAAEFGSVREDSYGTVPTAQPPIRIPTG